MEDKAIGNEEHELWYISKVLNYDNWKELIRASQIELARTNHLIDENMEVIRMNEVVKQI